MPGISLYRFFYVQPKTIQLWVCILHRAQKKERILQSRRERQVCGSGLGGFFTDWRPSWERSLSHLTHKAWCTAEEKLNITSGWSSHVLFTLLSSYMNVVWLKTCQVTLIRFSIFTVLQVRKKDIFSNYRSMRFFALWHYFL